MKLIKTIYFDEGSAADYIQICSGGELKKTTEFISEASGNAGANSNGELEINAKDKGLPKLFKALTGVGAQISVGGNAGVEAKKQRIAKTILENTLLSDFIELIESDNKKKKAENKKHTAIKQFFKIKLFPQANSFSYIMLMVPFFSMIDGNVPIKSDNGENFTMDISKIETAVLRGRGYYEFLSSIDGKEMIFRFSSTAFRNNYTMSDLPKMQLSLYAVSVGKIDKKKLDLTSEFQFGVMTKDRKEYDSLEQEADNLIEVFDVILAGITE